MRRYGLRDDQWERIKDLLPGREGHVGVTAKDNRLFVEAVLFRYRAGIPWRDLPERFGDWKVVHTCIFAAQRQVADIPINGMFGRGIGGLWCQSRRKKGRKCGPFTIPIVN